MSLSRSSEYSAGGLCFKKAMMSAASHRVGALPFAVNDLSAAEGIEALPVNAVDPPPSLQAKSVFVRPMLVYGRFAHPGQGRDRVYAGAVYPAVSKQFNRGIQNLVVRASASRSL